NSLCFLIPNGCSCAVCMSRSEESYELTICLVAAMMGVHRDPPPKPVRNDNNRRYRLLLLPQRYQLTLNRNAARDLHVEDSLERLGLSVGRNCKAQQQLLDGTLTAYEFHRSLGSHGGCARQDQH